MKPKTEEFLNFLLWTASGGTLAANVQGSTKSRSRPGWGHLIFTRDKSSLHFGHFNFNCSNASTTVLATT